MIRRVEVLHYRALKYINIELSNFQILVGPNGSGKSTFLDTLDFLKEALNESPRKAVEKRASHFDELMWKHEGKQFEISLELEIPAEVRKKLKDNEFTQIHYQISFHADEKKGVGIGGESLWLINNKDNQSLETEKSQNGRQLSFFPAEPEEPNTILHPRRQTPQGWRKIIAKGPMSDHFISETTDWTITYKLGPDKSSLARMPEDEKNFPVTLWARNVLMEGIQFLQLNSVAMRWPCRPDAPLALQVDGSNLPKVIQYLKKAKPASFDRWVKHVQTALPEIERIEVKERPEDRFLYLNIRQKSGVDFPSWMISDGTLRLLVLTLIAYLPEKNQIYMIEEPENGLHPMAIETVFQSLSSVYDNQVFLATHSPAVLRLAEPKEILCFSKMASGAVDIIHGDQHPRLKNWRKDVDLATLHGAGVLQ